MPTEPKAVPEPPPPPRRLSFWLAFPAPPALLLRKELPLGEAEAFSTGTAARPTYLAFPRLMAFGVGTTFLLLSASFSLTLVALADGLFRLPLALLLAHAPWFALEVRARRSTLAQMRGRQAQILAKPDLLHTPLGLIVSYQRGALDAGGVYFGIDREEGWNGYTGFDNLGEVGDHYAIRLRRRTAKHSVHRSGNGLFSREVRSKRRAVNLALITPPLASAWIASTGWRNFGWRSDVLAAFCLIAAYAVLLVTLALAPRFLSNFIAAETGQTEAKKARDENRRSYLYLVFDSREVALQEVLCRLQDSLEPPVE